MIKCVGKGNDYKCTKCKESTDPKAFILHLDGQSNWCNKCARLFHCEARIDKAIKKRGFVTRVKPILSLFRIG